MRIEWAIPCRYCEVTANEVSIIGGNANAFTVPEVPATIGVWIALQVVAPEHETGPDVPHRFRAHVLDPRMDLIPDTDLEIESFLMALPPVAGWEAEEVVASQHWFTAEEEGIYTIEMRVDDRTKTVAIGVRLAEDESDRADDE